MIRGLPYSLAVHLLIMLGTVLYGAYVPAPAIERLPVIRVQTVSDPRLQPTQPSEPEPAAPLPEPDLPEPPPEPEPEPEPTPPEPVPVPEPEPEEVVVEPPEEPEPEPEPEEEESPRASPITEFEDTETSDQTSDQPATNEPAISATDEPFPYAWYLDLVKGRITRHWNPPQLGIRHGDERTCAVHFFIEQGGSVTRATLVQSSGITLLDREGIRAVQAAHPLPPLPRGFTSRSLGVTFVFHLRSGL